MTDQGAFQPGSDEQAVIVYNELRRIAAGYMRRERNGFTLQATGLVHEAYLRLTGSNLTFNDENHFIGIAARSMRQILVDRARARGAQNRWAELDRVSLHASLVGAHSEDAMLPALDEALLTAPGICTVYALEEVDEEVVIATEYVDGQTLREEVARGQRPSAVELLETARALAAALAVAHARGVTHRELKPENVMRANSGGLKILDFGLALVDALAGDLGTPRVTTPGTLIGTPAYMAPEQLNEGVVDPRTDVFAFGVLLYECAVGHHPFEAASPLAMAARILEGEHDSLAAARRDLPLQLTAAIERCLRKLPFDRFASAADVVDALALSLENVVVPVERADAGWWRRHGAVVGWLVKDWQHGLADSGFIAIAMLTTVAGTLRGHLLFAQRAHDVGSFLAERRRSTPAIVALALTMAAMLVAEGLGVLIIGLGLGLTIARLVLEPSTTRVAFGVGYLRT